VLGDTQALRNLLLFAGARIIAPVIWAMGLVGNRIFWRGDVFYLKNAGWKRIADEAAGEQEIPRLFPI